MQVYCDMGRVCGCDEGRRGREGWMTVGNIDMTRHKENCPIGFREVTSSGKTMCGGPGTSCVSTTFSSRGVEYSQSLDTSLDERMPLQLITDISGLLTPTFLMALYTAKKRWLF